MNTVRHNNNLSRARPVTNAILATEIKKRRVPNAFVNNDKGEMVVSVFNPNAFPKNNQFDKLLYGHNQILAINEYRILD